MAEFNLFDDDYSPTVPNREPLIAVTQEMIKAGLAVYEDNAETQAENRVAAIYRAMAAKDYERLKR